MTGVLDKFNETIERTRNKIQWIDWPPEWKEPKTDIKAFDPRTLPGSKWEYLLLENPEVAAQYNIDISTRSLYF